MTASPTLFVEINMNDSSADMVTLLTYPPTAAVVAVHLILFYRTLTKKEMFGINKIVDNCR